MNKQRMQAYLELIENLFICPQGEEWAVLQQQGDLVDSELIQVMGMVAAQLRQQREVQKANWLENMVGQLMARAIGMERKAPSRSRELPVDLNGILQELLQPVRDVRQMGRRVELCRQALVLVSREANPDIWAALQSELGNSLAQTLVGKRAQNIEDAITAYKKSLQVYTSTEFPVDWSKVQHNLANTYSLRTQSDRAQNIENAITAYKLALQVRTREDFPLDWSMTQNNLANAYSLRIGGDRAQNIEDAITAYNQALQVRIRERFPLDWAMTKNDLACAYKYRIRGDRAQNIEDAITAYNQALQVRTRENLPLDWAMTLNNLATVYSNRIRGDRVQNIEDAITAYNQVLQVSTREDFPLDWAMTLNNLALAYITRIRGDHAQNIEDAITAYNQALEVKTREDFPLDWAIIQNNLARTYVGRIQGNRLQNVEKAIASYQQALQVRTKEDFPLDWAMTQHNLGVAYVFRVRGGRAQNIEDAINAYSQALAIYTPEAQPNNCRLTARSLGNLYADHDRWSEAKATYCTALDAAEILYQAAISKGSQEAELKETNDLYRRAAYAYAKVGDLETAIATIEQGRARSLSETLQRDRADLEAIRQINPELVDRYQTAANAIRLLESTERRTRLDSNQPQYSTEDFRNQATQARQALQDCLTEIRQIPGYESFLALPTFADIAATLQPGQPLIYLIPTPNGSLALTVSLPSPVWGNTEEHSPVPQTAAIWINDFTATDLLALLVNDTQTGWFDAYDNQTQNRDAWFAILDRTLHKLWQPLLAPLLHHLSQAKSPKATLIPTGLFSLLPLHAAWTPDANGNRRYACDFIQFTYAPNALALPAAREIATQTPATKLLAVNDPQPISAIPLPNTSTETANAIGTFPGSGNWQVLQHEAATPSAVLTALPSYPVAHFSCHGSANFQQPLDSGLLMAHDEILTLRDLLDLKLKGLRLAVLSACETGIPGTNLPDEVISLPTGLLQAGAAGVVSSLWSVADLSTMVLLSRFYQFWRTDGLEPPEALRQAQLWLRDSTGPELAPYLQASHPELATRLQQAANQRPFAHPFYWAAFTYVGV
jgi:CHAT domain-containing protein